MTQNQDDDIIFKISVVISLILHVLVIIWLYYNKDRVEKFPENNDIMTFEMLPISELSNVKPKQKKVAEQQKKPRKKITKKQATDTKKEQPKEKPQEQSKPKEQLKEKTQEEVKKAAKTAEKEKQSKAEVVENKEKPKKAKAKKQPLAKKPKPKPKKVAKKKQTKSEDPLDSLLKSIEKQQTTTQKMLANNVRLLSLEELRTIYDENSPLSLSEKNVLRQQIQQNWFLPAGIKKIEEMQVLIQVKVLKNGSINSTNVLGIHCPKGEEIGCEKLKESALRALKRSDPFQDLDDDRYEYWKILNITFSPINVMP